MSVTKLSLKNMIFYGYHGLYPAEQELGQRYEVDIELFSDFEPAGKADDFNKTINYVEVYTLVKAIVENKQYHLIEAIAWAIIERLRES